MTAAAAKRLYERGVAAANRGNFEMAVRLWRYAADQGDAKAQYNLGVAYARGIDIVKDHSEALKWLHRAAEQGHAKAEQRIGLARSKAFPGENVRQGARRIASLVKDAMGWLKRVVRGFGRD